jgi:hypothetical protein
MAAQAAPTASQRSHWPANEVSALPFHVPRSPISVWAGCGVPEMAGSTLFARAVPGRARTEATVKVSDAPGAIVRAWARS